MLFEQLNPSHLCSEDTTKVITMLGFEEGNEAPEKWGHILDGLFDKALF